MPEHDKEYWMKKIRELQVKEGFLFDVGRRPENAEEAEALYKQLVALTRHSEDVRRAIDSFDGREIR